MRAFRWFLLWLAGFVTVTTSVTAGAAEPDWEPPRFSEAEKSLYRDEAAFLRRIQDPEALRRTTPAELSQTLRGLYLSAKAVHGEASPRAMELLDIRINLAIQTGDGEKARELAGIQGRFSREASLRERELRGRKREWLKALQSAPVESVPGLIRTLEAGERIATDLAGALGWADEDAGELIYVIGRLYLLADEFHRGESLIRLEWERAGITSAAPWLNRISQHGSLADIYAFFGEKARAIRELEAARVLLDGVLGEPDSHSIEAAGLNRDLVANTWIRNEVRLMDLCGEAGDIDSAVATGRKAIEAMESLSQWNSANTWLALAKLLERDGQWQEAMAAVDRAGDAREETPARLLRLRCLAASGDPAKAAGQFEQLKSERAADLENLPFEIARFHRILGNDAAALEVFSAGLAKLEAAPAMVRARYFAEAVATATAAGNEALAARWADAWEGSVHEAIARSFDHLSESRRLAVTREFDTVSPAIWTGDSERIAKALLSHKGIVLETLLREKASASESPEAPGIAGRVLRLDLLELRQTFGGLGMTDEKLANEIETLRREIDEEAMNSGKGRERLVSGTDWRKFRQSIRKECPLVEFVRFHRPPSRERIQSTGEPAYGALVFADSEARPEWVDLGPASAVEAAIDVYQSWIRGERVSNAREPLPVETLHRLLWQPIADFLPSETKRVALSPDGALQYVHLGTLLNGNGRFVVEDFDLVYLNASRDYPAAIASLNPGESGLAKTKEGKWNLSLVADPDFDAGPLSTIDDSSKSVIPREIPGDFLFLPLPGTANEAAILAKLFREQAPETRITMFSGSEATLDNIFKPGQESPAVLHIATHGFHLPAGESPFTNPMTESGLAVAGANRDLAALKSGRFPDRSRGLVTAAAVARWPLANTELVVLSACETGLGRPQAGEGVLGLRRALAVAGAKTSILSLWPIPDRETVAWMERFYERILRQEDAPSVAACSVQREFLKGRGTRRETVREAIFEAGAFVAVANRRSN